MRDSVDEEHDDRAKTPFVYYLIAIGVFAVACAAVRVCSGEEGALAKQILAHRSADAPASPTSWLEVTVLEHRLQDAASIGTNVSAGIALLSCIFIVIRYRWRSYRGS